MDNVFNTTFNEITEFAVKPNAMRSLVILLVSMVAAYWVSRLLERVIITVAQAIAVRSDSATTESKKIKLRRVETYLSVSVAVMRAVVVGVVAFYAWQILSPSATLSTAAIGASAFFIVIAGATVGMLLRDVTAGSAMILERWFDIGDFIRVEPFMDVGGVVEQMTLRSTKLRNLNGEVIWLHNQYIQGVKVTPHGVRTIAVDVFTNDGQAGEDLIKWVIETIPNGQLTVTEPMRIVHKEKWSEKLWFFSVVGQTPPGREWLIENYFVESLKNSDEHWKDGPVMIRQPLVRYADPEAEKSFKRAVRQSKKSTAASKPSSKNGKV